VFGLGSIGLGILSLFGTFFSFDNGAPIEERIIRGEAADKIVIIPIHGPIGLASEGLGRGLEVTNESTVQEMLKMAAENPRVKAVVLDIDSPGGGVVAARKIYETVKKFTKPVVAAYTGNVAASGAVYLAAAADKIVSYPETLTGSIGVIIEFYDLSKLLETYGVQVNTLTTGKFKDMGSPTRPMTDEERRMIQELLNESYEQFVGVVAEGRHLPVEQVKSIADGQVFSGSKAKALGLVDEVGDRTLAEELAGELAGLADVQIVEYVVNDPFAPFLGLLQGKMDPVSQLSRLFRERQNQTSWQLAYRLN
jgi:protease-4